MTSSNETSGGFEAIDEPHKSLSSYASLVWRWVLGLMADVNQDQGWRLL
jgi:hypothetical protein